MVVGCEGVVGPHRRRPRGGAHVVEMVDHVVQVIAAERLDGELAAVAADAAPVPRQGRHGGVEIPDGVGPMIDGIWLA